MKDYVSIIAAIMAGISAVISAVIAWKLKGISDDRRDAADLRKERHTEAKALYESTFQLFEQAIREVWNRTPFTLAKEFNQNNARIHLIAPECVVQKYSEVAGLLESWSSLQAKANPRQMKMGDETVTIVQAPDPTAKYKEPAKVEHEKLQTALQELVALMRSELKQER